MNLDACLPPELRGPDTVVAPIAVGFSGAGVHRVDAGGRAYVLKVSAADQAPGAWRRAVEAQRLAADAGIAPRVVHVDDACRAVVSEHLVDRSFAALCGNPLTREAALALLGATVRRLHALPPPAGAEPADPRASLRAVAAVASRADVPAFVADAVRGALDEPPPPAARAPVLSHNDLNPSNLLYDGERLVLLDWDAAAPNDPYYDLAVAALFMRLDDGDCARLIAAYDGVTPAADAPLPPRFRYFRRLAATFAGVMFFALQRDAGPGAAGETLDSTPSLADVYGRMRAGALDLRSNEGKRAFALALVRAGVEYAR